MSIDVALRDGVDARECDQICVRADRVERIELDAAQLLEEPPHSASAAANGTGETQLSQEMTARFVPRDAEHEGGLPQCAMRAPMRLWFSVAIAVWFALPVGCGAALPEITAVLAFPTQRELAAIAAPEVPAAAPVAVSESVELTFESPPEFGVGNATVDDGPVATVVRASGVARVASTVGMKCAADTLARFFLREQARPTGPVLEFVLGRCGVTGVEARLTVHSREISEPLDDEAIAAGHGVLFGELRPVLESRAIPFEVEIGSGFATNDGSAVWLVVTAPRRATLSATRLVGARYLISGRLQSERVRAVEAWVNQGEYGVERCETDPSAQLPDVRFTCAMNPHDPTARVDLVATPRQRLFSQRVATVLLHRDDEASLSYRAQPELPPSAAAGDVAAQLGAALVVARLEAGQDADGALATSAPESLRHALLLDALIRADAAGDSALVERLKLGLLAGWDTGASIASAEAYFSVGRASRVGTAHDPRSFMRDQLTIPSARRVLLSPGADLVAVAAQDTEAGFVGTLTFYRTWDDAKLAEFRRAWAEQLEEERARGGVSHLVMLGDVLDVQQEADKVTRGDVHPHVALEDAMARLRGRFGSTVRGWYVEAYDPGWVELPIEFQDSGAVRAVTGVAWHRPEGAAWGQLVLFLCVLPAE